MDETTRKKIGLFKYGLIAPVLHGHVAIQATYFEQLAQKEFEVPYRGKRKYKAQTFKKWLKEYRRHGFEALMPKI